MGYSPLVTRIQPPRRQTYGNKWSSRIGKRVSRVIVHHWAGTAGGVERLVNSSDKASANYIILTNGDLIGSVDEEHRAWTSGSAAADRTSITIEVQNSTGAPEWRVSDAALTTLTALVADIGTRHGFVPRAGSTVRGHRDFAATACPGPYLAARLAQIAQPPPTAPPKKGHDMIELIRTLYRRYLNRPPTPAEELAWSDAFDVLDLTPADGHAHFRTSPAEGGTVTAAYRAHLGRDATEDEIRTWSTQGLTIDEVWTGVSGSSEAAARR